MAGNNITYEAAPDIAACLEAKRHLKRLNLSKNDLKDEGCVVILKGIEEVKEIFKNRPKFLWTFDENDPDGVNGDDNA
ncbi:hypothetical protein F2Q70_00037677 [Brassica cretica]|uniref:Uncharacterized protein n=1 Tax=Brassica cretica TaxID=69181 RepID=A0A8S9JXT4_BRACR|nr:hypothetical protein F2Q70_00037677 [Brassica cretica]